MAEVMKHFILQEKNKHLLLGIDVADDQLFFRFPPRMIRSFWVNIYTERGTCGGGGARGHTVTVGDPGKQHHDDTEPLLKETRTDYPFQRFEGKDFTRSHSEPQKSDSNISFIHSSYVIARLTHYPYDTHP